MFYYGRGAISGDWYVAVDGPAASVEQSDEVVALADELVALAERDGENIIRFPKPPHPRMVRLKWWIDDGGGKYLSSKSIEQTAPVLIRFMEAHPPISVN